MIKEIEDKRQVKFEADRHKPIDQNELFNHSTIFFFDKIGMTNANF